MSTDTDDEKLRNLPDFARAHLDRFLDADRDREGVERARADRRNDIAHEIKDVDRRILARRRDFDRLGISSDNDEGLASLRRKRDELQAEQRRINEAKSPATLAGAALRRWARRTS